MKHIFEMMAEKDSMPKAMYLRILKGIYRKVNIRGNESETKKRRSRKASREK